MQKIKETPLVRRIRSGLASAEARWFDWWHNTETLAAPNENDRDWTPGYPYLPIRPPTARRVLRSLPIGNASDYTFVDLGSGKGRMLLIASEFPFRKIVGVEMRPDLHEQAMENLRRGRHLSRQCFDVESVLVDATRYEFPAGKLVVYLFNPFGGEVMATVLRRLDDTFDRNPREIVLIYVYPESGFLLKKMRNFQVCEETSRYCMAKTESTPVPPEHTLKR